MEVKLTKGQDRDSFQLIYFHLNIGFPFQISKFAPFLNAP